MEKIKIVTTNDLKFSHISNFLSKEFICEKATLDITEIQGSKDEIVKHKLQIAFNYFKEPVLVDDTSLEIEDLGGFPGPYIKDFVKTFGLKNIAQKFNNTRAKTICNIGFTRDGVNFLFGYGEVVGKIHHFEDVSEKETQMEFMFIPDHLNKSLAQISFEKEKQYFNRYLAVKDLLEKIK